MTTVAQKPQAPAAASAPQGGGGQINSAFVQSKMQIPPNLQVPFQKIMLAGKAIMYSQHMAPQIAALVKNDDPMGQKIGDGVVALMALLISQSNHTMPPQLIIPCATAFVTEFADFLRHAGLQVQDGDVAEGMSAMIGQIMQRVGITPQKLQAMLASKRGGQPPGAPAAGAPVPGGAQPPAGAPAPGGLVGGAMSGGAPQGA